MLDCPGSPLYRFGYGLTYSHFELSGQPRGARRGWIPHRQRQRQKQRRAGGEYGVAGVHTSAPCADQSTCARLVGHQRLALAPGEIGSACIEIPRESLAYTHRDGSRSVDAGTYDVFIGQDSSDGEALVVAVS